MSEFMTDEEIQAEQALMLQQQMGQMDLEATAERAPLITEEQADAVTPLDLLHADNYTTKAIRNERLDICRGCDRLFKPTNSCKECGCFMALKTWLSDATCPIGKW